MMAEESEAAAAALDAGGTITPNGDDEARQLQLQKLETERLELVEKLKKAMAGVRALKKQLEDVRAENERLKAEGADLAILQQELQLKEEEKQEIVTKLQDVISRYQALQQQLEGKDGELQVAQSKVEAFKVELQSQQEAASQTQEKDALTISELNDNLQKTTRRLAQEEARVMVFQEENNRLTHQVASMLEDKQQQERETQELVAENDTLQTKVDDLVQQVSGARQQQEDTEQMYLEVASKLNQALRDNDELKNGMAGSDNSKQELSLDRTESTDAADRARDFEEQIEALESKAAKWQAELSASTEKWELERKELVKQVETLTSFNDKAQTDLARVAEIREQLLVNVGIDLTYESIESLLDTKSNEIRMLTEQLAVLEGPQEQAIREAVSVAVSESEGFSSQLDALRIRYDALAAEKIDQDMTVKELHAELERITEQHTSLLSSQEDEHQRNQEGYVEEAVKLTALLEDSQVQNQQLEDDILAIETKIQALVGELQVDAPVDTESNTGANTNLRLAKLELHLEHIREQLLSAAKTDVDHLRSQTNALQSQLQTYETENQQLTAKLEECEETLKARATEMEKLAARTLEASSDVDKWSSHSGDAGSVVSNGDTVESCNGGASDLKRDLEAANARLHAVETEMAACKAENLRMIFEVAKTADGVAKLKQDHDILLETHSEKSTDMDAMIEQLESLTSTNQTLEMQLKSTSDDLRCQLEASVMQKENFQSVIANLNHAVVEAENENSQIMRDLNDIKTENDVLEERIHELHAVADSKTEPDESLEKDREVEELRSSLVQAKVDFLEQKQQLTALEKKLVEVSQKPGGKTTTVNIASLDAERREFEAALIEMIEMEQKLQVAYEAKQGLESTLQERMQAKEELDNRLSVAEDKIVELEQQLEQKVALIATIEEQLRSVEEERERLSDDFAKAKSKLERSKGKLEEKAIEFEAFKTTTNMLKDERSRLFNEISLLQDKIAKSEEQKAAMADSQELANEELEEQLNELADKIAEIESEKQELRARLEETVYQSEEDIHQLRERLYMTEEEKSRLDGENTKLMETIEALKTKLMRLEDEKTDLEVAYKSRSEQLSVLEAQVENTKSEIATLSTEKENLVDSKRSLEESVSALHDETTTLKQTLDETSLKLQNELGQMTAQIEALRTQLGQTTTEKDEITGAFAELKERVQAEKVVNEEISAKLEAQLTENNALENKVVALKNMAEKALQSVQSTRNELSETEVRITVLTEEHDAAKAALGKKEAACEELTALQGDLQQEVDKLNSEMETLQCKHEDEYHAIEETVRDLKNAETQAVASLEAVKTELADAESCVMVLVEERDAARKGLSAKDLKIEMLTTQQGELDLAAQKLENKLKTLQSKSSAQAEAAEATICELRESTAQAEEAARTLKDSSAQAKELLQDTREQLAEAELQVTKLEKERDVTRMYLNEKVSTHETLSALQEDLQNKVQTLDMDLKELQKTSSVELATANDKVMSLTNAEAETVETLASVRKELSETEGCVMVLVEERDAAKKALSKKELSFEVLCSEHGELELKTQSVATELEALRVKSSVDTQAAEETARDLKETVTLATEALGSAQKELSESESLAALLTAERDAVNETLQKLNAEHKSLGAEKEGLLQSIESLEASIKTLQNQHSNELESAEDTIRTLKASEDAMTDTLESVRRELSESQSQLSSLTELHNETKSTLTDKELIITSTISQTETLQERVQSLETELEQLQNQRAAEAQTVEETINNLKVSESQTAETLESVRQQLSEAEARVASVVEERDAASKTVNEMESHREVQSTEVEGLQERVQSLETELEQLQNQRAAEAQTVEETINNLKVSESQTAETLESVRQQLSEAEARVASVVEERDAASKTVNEMESHREVQSTEVEGLQERVQSLETELEQLQNQRAAEAQTVEETINNLKVSESQTAETLESVRQQLSEAEARVASVVEAREVLMAVLKEKEVEIGALSSGKLELCETVEAHVIAIRDLEGQLEVESSNLSGAAQQVQNLQTQVSELEGQLRDQVQTFKVNSGKEIEALKEQNASLSDSSNSALEEVAALREQNTAKEQQYAGSIAQKDEVILTLKSKMEEVMVAYKRLKGHLQELQERVAQKAKTNDSLQASYDELQAQHAASIEQLDALELEFTSSREKSDVLAEELCQAADKLADSEAQRESQMENFKKRVLVYDDELAHMQKQREVALQEQKETLLAESSAREEASLLKFIELEKSCTTLTETVAKKEAGLQTLAERLCLLEQEHSQAGDDREETKQTHKAERMELEAQLSTANAMIEKLRSTSTANIDLQRETVAELEIQVNKLKLEVKVETEGANAARAALETYKKRAHTALKKATSESKLNLKKSAQHTAQLGEEVVTAKGRINILETELEETRRRMAELESAGDAREQSARKALEAEKRSQMAALLSEIDSLKADVTRLEAALEGEKAPLEVKIKQLTEQNEVLAQEIDGLKEQVRSHNETTQQEIEAKEDEINDLSKQLQAALAAAASLATSEAERRMYSPPSSPTEKERRSSSTVSSSRRSSSSSRSLDYEGNNSFLHQATIGEHQHISTAVADSCPVPLSKTICANGVRDGDDEAVKLKLQLNELELKAHLFQKKFEDTAALLEEATRQKQRLQELSEHSTQAINIEYLKNVVMKYIESQVPSEKEQLVPVISTLLHFSPQEQQNVLAAHSKTNDEGAGLFGGVFSYFGGSTPSAPAPKPLAAPHNFKPSPSSVKGNTNGAALGSKDKNGVLSFGSDDDDDDEFTTVLNPFAT
ncbi:hypothetical protein JM18_003477 [Phytophthora kernoviae]|uniref:GRIP domain-containing protein n=1 Tax=Phytophthora kernoviae TaxID=325452 RepID=A0A921VBE4_9STRA|nr:hypothetical protein JM18_003477 [Phytophthora kernoviae]